MVTVLGQSLDQESEGVQGEQVVEAQFLLEFHRFVHEVLNVVRIATPGSGRGQVVFRLEDMGMIRSENSDPLVQQILVQVGCRGVVTHQVMEMGDMAQRIQSGGIVGSKDSHSIGMETSADKDCFLRTTAQCDRSSQVAARDHDRGIVGSEKSFSVDEELGQYFFCLSVATSLGESTTEKASPDQDPFSLWSLQGRPLLDELSTEFGSSFGTALFDLLLRLDGELAEALEQLLVVHE